MKIFLGWIAVALGLGAFAACDRSDEAGDAQPAVAQDAPTVLDLDDVSANPDAYRWFDFRPNVKKLILSGAAETEHVAILWYTTEDGGVGLHYHAKTESVYVIEGSQTDGKGVYPTGSVYFNPPGSGHQITNSSGFFLLAYASPPDFMATDLIEEYTPVRIDTSMPDLARTYPLERKRSGVRTYTVPLDTAGGMAAELVEISAGSYSFRGNYLVVVEGACEIAGVRYGRRKAAVAKTIEPGTFVVAADGDERCFLLGVSF